VIQNVYIGRLGEASFRIPLAVPRPQRH